VANCCCASARGDEAPGAAPASPVAVHPMAAPRNRVTLPLDENEYLFPPTFKPGEHRFSSPASHARTDSGSGACNLD
jgi:hypothetical protein